MAGWKIVFVLGVVLAVADIGDAARKKQTQKPINTTKKPSQEEKGPVDITVNSFENTCPSSIKFEDVKLRVDSEKKTFFVSSTLVVAEPIENTTGLNYRLLFGGVYVFNGNLEQTTFCEGQEKSEITSAMISKIQTLASKCQLKSGNYSLVDVPIFLSSLPYSDAQPDDFQLNFELGTDTDAQICIQADVIIARKEKT